MHKPKLSPEAQFLLFVLTTGAVFHQFLEPHLTPALHRLFKDDLQRVKSAIDELMAAGELDSRGHIAPHVDRRKKRIKEFSLYPDAHTLSSFDGFLFRSHKDGEPYYALVFMDHVEVCRMSTVSDLSEFLQMIDRYTGNRHKGDPSLFIAGLNLLDMGKEAPLHTRKSFKRHGGPLDGQTLAGLFHD